MRISDHGGNYGGSGVKKMFHKHESLTIPLTARSFTAYRTNGRITRYANVYYVPVRDNSQNLVNLVSYDLNLRQLAVVDTWREYSSFWTSFNTYALSESHGKLVSVDDISGSSAVRVRGVTEQGTFSSDQRKLLGTHSSTVQSLALDDAKGLFYCVWSTVLYCFELRNFTNVSNPVWTVNLSQIPNQLLLVGDRLYLFRNDSYVAYDVSSVSPTLLGSVSTSINGSGFTPLSDGLSIYTVGASTGAITRSDLNFNVITTNSTYRDARPDAPIARSYNHPGNSTSPIFVDNQNLYVRSNGTVIVLDKSTLNYVDERLIPGEVRRTTEITVTLDEYVKTPFYDTKDNAIIGTITQAVTSGGSAFTNTQMSKLKLKY